MADIPHVFAFDPGDMSGWCYFKDGTPESFGQFAKADTTDLLRQIAYDPKLKDLGKGEVIFVIEDFRLFGHKARQQTGSQMVAAQVIGALRMAASLLNAEVVMQPASILPIAERMAQTKMPSKHSESHQVSAYLHGYYWLVKNEHILTKLQEEMQNGKS